MISALEIFANTKSLVGAGLDYGYLAIIAAIILALGGAWVYANRRLSNFNKENGEEKQQSQDELNQNIYKEGTAPLVVAINSYISEQVILEFEIEEREIIERYEETRAARMNPLDPGFINLSNFADTIEYDQKVKGLIDSHAAIEKNENDYESMKKNLRNISIFVWFPIFTILGSLALHFVGFLVFNNATHFGYLTQTTLVLGIIFAIPSVIFYVRYMNCVRRIDKVREATI